MSVRRPIRRRLFWSFVLHDAESGETATCTGVGDPPPDRIELFEDDIAELLVILAAEVRDGRAEIVWSKHDTPGTVRP